MGGRCTCDRAERRDLGLVCVTKLVALLFLGLLSGFGGALVTKAVRDGRHGFALAATLVLVPVVAYLVWLSLMGSGAGRAPPA